jgi:hypothetical protein
VPLRAPPRCVVLSCVFACVCDAPPCVCAMYPSARTAARCMRAPPAPPSDAASSIDGRGWPPAIPRRPTGGRGHDIRHDTLNCAGGQSGAGAPRRPGAGPKGARRCMPPLPCACPLLATTRVTHPCVGRQGLDPEKFPLNPKPLNPKP